MSKSRIVSNPTSPSPPERQGYFGCGVVLLLIILANLVGGALAIRGFKRDFNAALFEKTRPEWHVELERSSRRGLEIYQQLLDAAKQRDPSFPISPHDFSVLVNAFSVSPHRFVLNGIRPLEGAVSFSVDPTHSPPRYLNATSTLRFSQGARSLVLRGEDLMVHGEKLSSPVEELVNDINLLSPLHLEPKLTKLLEEVDRIEADGDLLTLYFKTAS